MGIGASKGQFVPSFGKPGQPQSPDYAGAAGAQGLANRDASYYGAVYGNPNVYSPYGTQTVQFSGPGSQANVYQTLNPESQKIFDEQQRTRLGLAQTGTQAVGNVQNVLGQPFDPSGVPGVQTGMGDGGNLQRNLDLSGVAHMPVNAGTTGQEAIMARLQPQIQQDRTSVETQLTNQGLRPGTQAWDNAMRVENQRENDLTSQAALQGIGLDMSANQQGFGQALQEGQFGNQAQAQKFNELLQAGQFGNTAQQQAMAQALYQRNLPLNEISALMSGSQINNPQFQPYQGQGVNPAPIFQGSQSQGAWDQNLYNQNVGSYNNMMSGLFSLGGAAMKSDRRLKSDIERIGTHPLGIGVYRYVIDGRPEIGVMADEVEKVKPQAVMTGVDGYKRVFYGML